jgi:hypothetical protein
VVAVEAEGPRLSFDDARMESTEKEIVITVLPATMGERHHCLIRAGFFVGSTGAAWSCIVCSLQVTL